MAEKDVLKWGNDQQTKLNDLAQQYFDLDAQIKQLTKKKEKMKSEIGELMTKYSQKKVITEGFNVSYIHVAGSMSFNTAAAKAKLIELKVELDDSFYKLSKDSYRLDISKVKEPDENDPHRIKVTLDDLQI